MVGQFGAGDAHVGRYARKQIEQRIAFSRGKTGADGPFQLRSEGGGLVKNLGASAGQMQPAAAPVGGMRPSLEQPFVFEVVDQRDHCAGRDAQPFGNRLLRLAIGRPHCPEQSEVPWLEAERAHDLAEAVALGLVTFVLLARAFRSLVLPLKAVLANLISVGAAYGVLVLVWQRGFGSQAIWGLPATGAITAWIPPFVFAFLYGLSMDYEVFLLSRMREEYDRSGSTTEAVVTGVGRTGRPVTSAALILFLAMAALASVRASGHIWASPPAEISESF